jgi:hypothetical protein
MPIDPVPTTATTRVGRPRRCLTAVATAALLVMFPALSACTAVGAGLTAAATGTVATVLNGLLDNVQSAIRTAAAQGNGVVITAGSQARTAIEQFQQELGDQLNKTVADLDAASARQLDKLTTVVDDLNSGNRATVAAAGQQAEQVGLTLPLANTQPQITSYAPHMVAPGGTNPLPVVVKGVFAFVGQKDLQPVLTVDGDQIAPSQTTTQQITFPVPAAKVRTAAAPTEIGLLSAVLDVPYRDVLSGATKTATYNLEVGVLPRSPGQLSLITKQHSPKQSRQHVVDQGHQQYSSNDDLDGNYTSTPPAAGWTIDPKTARFIVTWSQGDENDQWSKSLLVNDGHSITYQVHTVHHRIGTSGKVDFHLEYDLVHTEDQITTKTEPLTIAWGNTITRPIIGNEWQIVFQSFDGQHQEISTDYRGKYLTISATGTTLTIHAADPASLTE